MKNRTDKPRRRFPPWLRKKLPLSPEVGKLKRLLGTLKLNTVCVEAKCPNLWECFSRGTATFMILGRHCTRNCRFCAVQSGPPSPPDPEEPAHIAQAASTLELEHVVITSVTRDDMPDGGAGRFAAVIQALRKAGSFTVEVLIPDFQGNLSALETVLAAGPDILGHNVETVPRLYARVRPGADYVRSLRVLAEARRQKSPIVTKSGLMLGLGEQEEEVLRTLTDLRQTGCQMVTLGQYLCPSEQHYPVQRFIPPGEFDYFRQEGLRMGFASVASGPFVRSSYLAEEQFHTYKNSRTERQKTSVIG